MASSDRILARAKRLDRLMTWIISLGGMLIIAAVLGIMVFIARETLPLFHSARTQSVAKLKLPATGNLFLDETGQAAMVMDPKEGLLTYALPKGESLPSLTDGPARPWKFSTSPDGRGVFAVIGSDDKLALGQFKWDKPAVASEASNWTPVVTWQGELFVGQSLSELLNVRAISAGGLEGGTTLKVLARSGTNLVWAKGAADAPASLEWKPVELPQDVQATKARWSQDGNLIFVGTRQGRLLLLDASSDSPSVVDSLELGEGISALGFDLGMSALLVGGERGSLKAVQSLNQEGTQHLQCFHTFQPMKGAVKGFMASQRDKRFLAWSEAEVVVDHVTTEKRLAHLPGTDIASAALSARGASIATLSDNGELQDWSLDAAHPEVSAKILWQKVHYEGYQKPEYVWQSTGGSDDFEPKLSLVPLVFGTLKGTLYAMLFALPLAVLGALYTSQFATPKLRNIIKPLIEVMAALPSVVLGFIAGLVLAPLFERSATQVLVMPLCILAAALILLPLWSLLPFKLRNRLSLGHEVLWAIPVLVFGLLLAKGLAPSFERFFMQGDYRAWLLSHHGITYDQRNSIVVGFAMGFAVIPIIFTISEDALTSVPRSLTSASLACGASPWQTAWRVVLPTASPGIFSAIMVGFGRAIGETMIVLMATGNTPVMDWNPFNGMRTLAANIAVETPEAPMHGTLYRVLFFTALLLFALTFLLNTVAELVRQHLRKRYESL